MLIKIKTEKYLRLQQKQKIRKIRKIKIKFLKLVNKANLVKHLILSVIFELNTIYMLSKYVKFLFYIKQNDINFYFLVFIIYLY